MNTGILKSEPVQAISEGDKFNCYPYSRGNVRIMTRVTSNSSRKVVYGTGLGLVHKERVKNQKYSP